MTSFRPAVLCACLTLLLCPAGSKAQPDDRGQGKWHGQLELISGLGISRTDNDKLDLPTDTLFHLREQFIARLTRTAPTLTFSTIAQGSFVRNQTMTRRATYYSEREAAVNGANDTIRQPEVSFRSDLNWHPSSKHLYTAFLTYQQSYNHTGNAVASIKSDLDQAFSFNVASEDRRSRKQEASAGWRSRHELDSPRRMILTAGEWNGSYSDRNAVWAKLTLAVSGEDIDQASLYNYRLTPHTYQNNGLLSLSFRDSLLTGARTLTIEPELRFRLSDTRDHNSGAVQDSLAIWRDSTAIRETFRFFTVQAEPALRIEYLHAPLRVSANYSLQFYGRQLTSQLHYGPLERLPAVVIGRSFAEWAAAEGMALVLGSTISIARPTFLQTCWYERQYADPQQLFVGNPDLLPTRTVSTDLTWRMRKGRFRLSTTTTYAFRLNEVEQFFWDDEIEGKNYRIFSWVNTAYGHTFVQNLQLGWNGRVFSSTLQVNYRQKQQKALIADTENKANDWELLADVGIRPGRGWSFTARGQYQGDIRTLYSLTHQYYTVNARISKEFRQFSLYLEGRDLFDKPVTTEFLSRDLTENWIEISNLNRQLFLLGLSWTF